MPDPRKLRVTDSETGQQQVIDWDQPGLPDENYLHSVFHPARPTDPLGAGIAAVTDPIPYPPPERMRLPRWSTGEAYGPPAEDYAPTRKGATAAQIGRPPGVPSPEITLPPVGGPGPVPAPPKLQQALHEPSPEEAEYRQTIAHGRKAIPAVAGAFMGVPGAREQALPEVGKTLQHGIRVAGTVMAPTMLVGGATKPITTGLSLASGGISQEAVKRGLQELGLPEEWSEVAGDFAGVLAGWATWNASEKAELRNRIWNSVKNKAPVEVVQPRQIATHPPIEEAEFTDVPPRQLEGTGRLIAPPSAGTPRQVFPMGPVGGPPGEPGRFFEMPGQVSPPLGAEPPAGLPGEELSPRDIYEGGGLTRGQEIANANRRAVVNAAVGHLREVGAQQEHIKYALEHPGEKGVEEFWQYLGSAPGVSKRPGYSPSQETRQQIYDELFGNLPGEEPQRTSTGGIRWGGSPRLAGILKANLYSGNPVRITMKELLQNAQDAVREVPNPQVKVTVHEPHGDEKYIEVSDNGKGMTEEQVATVLMDPGESGKAAEGSASGGLGLAKAAILFNPKRIFIDTRSQGQRTWFEATGDEIKSPEGIQHHYEPYDGPSGTTIRAYFDSSTNLWPARDFLKDFRRSIKAPAEVQAFRPNKYAMPGEPKEKALFSPNDLTAIEPLGKVLAEGTVPGVMDYTIHAAPKSGIVGALESMAQDTIQVEVNNNGLYQFTSPIYAPSGSKIADVPPRLAVDVRSLVGDDDPLYPFTANREALKDNIWKHIANIIKDSIVNPGVEKYRQEAIAKYGNLPSMPAGKGVPGVAVYDHHGVFKPTELNRITKEPDIQNLMGVIHNVTKNIIGILENTSFGAERGFPGLGSNVERVGMLLSKTAHGIWVPNLQITDKRAGSIFIDPFVSKDIWNNHPDSIRDPSSLTARILQTIKHEIVHDQISGHYEDFTTGEKYVEEAVGFDAHIQLGKRIKDAITDPATGELRAGYLRAISAYHTVVGRGGGEEVLSGGVVSGRRPENPRQLPGGPRESSTEAFSNSAPSSLDKAINSFIQDEEGTFRPGDLIRNGGRILSKARSQFDVVARLADRVLDRTQFGEPILRETQKAFYENNGWMAKTFRDFRDYSQGHKDWKGLMDYLSGRPVQDRATQMVGDDFFHVMRDVLRQANIQPQTPPQTINDFIDALKPAREWGDSFLERFDQIRSGKVTDARDAVATFVEAAGRVINYKPHMTLARQLLQQIPPDPKFDYERMLSKWLINHSSGMGDSEIGSIFDKFDSAMARYGARSVLDWSGKLQLLHLVRFYMQGFPELGAVDSLGAILSATQDMNGAYNRALEKGLLVSQIKPWSMRRAFGRKGGSDSKYQQLAQMFDAGNMMAKILVHEGFRSKFQKQGLPDWEDRAVQETARVEGITSPVSHSWMLEEKLPKMFFMFRYFQMQYGENVARAIHDFGLHLGRTVGPGQPSGQIGGTAGWENDPRGTRGEEFRKTWDDAQKLFRYALAASTLYYLTKKTHVVLSHFRGLDWFKIGSPQLTAISNMAKYAFHTNRRTGEWDPQWGRMAEEFVRLRIPGGASFTKAEKGGGLTLRNPLSIHEQPSHKSPMSQYPVVGPAIQ